MFQLNVSLIIMDINSNRNSVDIPNFRQEARNLCAQLPEIDAHHTMLPEIHDVLKLVTLPEQTLSSQRGQPSKTPLQTETHTNVQMIDTQTLSDDLDSYVDLDYENSEHFKITSRGRSTQSNQSKYWDLYEELFTLITRVQTHLSKAKKVLRDVQNHLQRLNQINTHDIEITAEVE